MRRLVAAELRRNTGWMDTWAPNGEADETTEQGVVAQNAEDYLITVARPGKYMDAPMWRAAAAVLRREIVIYVRKNGGWQQVWRSGGGTIRRALVIGIHHKHCRIAVGSRLEAVIMTTGLAERTPPAGALPRLKSADVRRRRRSDHDPAKERK